MAIKYHSNIRLMDNNVLQIGTGGDLRLEHTGSHSNIYNTTGNLNFINYADDSDIIFQSDDGSGGVETYFYLDGSHSSGNPYTHFPDNSHLVFGASTDDLDLYHNGTNSYIQNTTGNLIINQRTNDGDLILQCDDGSGGETAYITLDGSQEAVVFGKAPHIPEYILHDGDGNTYFGFAAADTFRVGVGGTTRLDIATGIELTGNTTLDGNFTVGSDGAGHDVKFFLNASGRYIMVDEDDNSLLFTDNASAKWGNGGDLQLMHDGTDSRIDNMVGHLKIRNYSDDSDIIFETDNGSGSTTEYFRLDGGDVRTIFSQDTKHSDSVRARFGNSSDFQIYHNGTNTIMTNGTGEFRIIQSKSDADLVLQCDDGSGGETAYITLDGSATTVEIAKATNVAANVTATKASDTRIESKATTAGAYFRANSAANDYFGLELTHDTTAKWFLGNYVDHASLSSGDFAIVSGAKSNGNVRLKIDSSGDTTFGGNVTASNLISSGYVKLGADDQLISDGSITVEIDYNNNQTDRFFKVRKDNSTDLFTINEDASATFTGSVEITSSSVTDFLKLTSGGSSANPVKLIFEKGASEQGIIEYNRNGDLEIYNTDGDGGVMISGSASADPDFYISHAGASTFKSTLTVGVDDTGHDVIFYGATSGRYLQWDESGDALKLTDNVVLYVGSSNDAAFWHNGTDTFIENFSGGNLYIDQEVNDADIVLRCDDGSGGVTPYITLDGGLGYTTAQKQIRFADSVEAQFGGIADLTIAHDATDSIIANNTGDLYIKNRADDKDIIFQSDDGSGGVTEYFRLDGSSKLNVFSQNARVEDNIAFQCGGGNDLRIYHDATDSYIDNATNDLYIRNLADDKDIIFQSDDGSGGVEIYFYLDGSMNTDGTPKTVFPDNSKLQFGSGAADLRIYHDGTDSRIYNDTGDFVFRNNQNDGDIKFQCDDGSGGTTTYFQLDGGASQTVFSKHAQFVDGQGLLLGSGTADLQIVHNGTDSYISNDTGDLIIQQKADDKDIIFKCDDGSGGLETYFFLDGSLSSGNPFTIFPDSSILGLGSGADVQFYHDGSNMTMINTTGSMAFYQSVDDGDMVFYCDDGSGGLTAYITLDGSAETTIFSKQTTFNNTVVMGSQLLKFADNGKANFGDSNDLQIYHDGSHNYIDAVTGDQDIIFKGTDSSSDITALTLDMSDAGTAIFNHDIKIADDGIIKVGNDTDLYITHDASNSHIVNATGDLKITQNANDKDIIFNCDDGSGGNTAYLTLDGSVGYTLANKHIRFADDVEARFGAGSDLRIYHDGNNNFVDGYNGHVYIRNTVDNHDIVFQTDDGSGGITAYMTLDGSEEKVVVNKPSQRTFEVSDASTHGDANGDIVYFGGTTSMSAGKIYHYKANGTWELADADAASTSDGLLAVAIGAASDTNGMLLRGMVTLDHDPGNLGDVLFLSTTAGEATGTAPSGSGDIVRVVGYLLGGAHGQIYFNPDGAFVEVA